MAAAALLDTLDAVIAAPVAERIVAMTGDLADASRSAELGRRLADFTVIGQRGDGFAERLANAHSDASDAAHGLPVLQVGMDTPQVTADLLAECATQLLASDAVLGMADDGGWWILGVTEPAMAECLRSVPMSTADTGAVTLDALRATGIGVHLTSQLADVDTIDDVASVGRLCAADSRFRQVALAVEVRSAG